MKIYQLTNYTHVQMMCYIIVTDGGKVIAVDGGWHGQSHELYRVLKMVGGKVDMWFMTHPHGDHYGSIIELFKIHNDIEVGGFWHSSMMMNKDVMTEDEYTDAKKWYDFIKKTYVPVRELAIGDQFKLDEVTIDILGIANHEITKNIINNQSVVFKVSDDDFSMMFLGDLGVEGGEKLLNMYGDKLKSDAVQMAHHGQGGVERAVYENIAPTYAFWPTPDWLWENRTERDTVPNTRNFKTPEVIKWMEELGAINITNFYETKIFDTKTKEITVV